jgi:hypothetical protein
VPGIVASYAALLHKAHRRNGRESPALLSRYRPRSVVSCRTSRTRVKIVVRALFVWNVTFVWLPITPHAAKSRAAPAAKTAGAAPEGVVRCAPYCFHALPNSTIHIPTPTDTESTNITRLSMVSPLHEHARHRHHRQTHHRR